MTMQQYMGVIKASFCIALVLNLAAAASIEEENKEAQEEFLSQLFDPQSRLLDDDTAEVLWTTCWEDLIHSKKEVGDLDLCLPQESPSSTNEISTKSGSVDGKNYRNLIDTCHSQLKQNFIRCLRKHNLPIAFHVSREEEDDSKIWHANYVRSFPSRRNLGHVLPQHVSKEQDSRDIPPPPPKRKSGKTSKRKSKSIKHSDHQQTVVLAIAITALITFVIAAVCFICCCRCGRGRVSQNDERPLLSMSMSDCSVGSSSNNNPYKSSMKDEKLHSSSNNLFDDKMNSVQEMQSAGVASAAARPSFDLKPPPGRVGAIPLKPPPGKLGPLPPEPPSFEPSGNATAAAAAPAPPPPAPPRLSSGGPPPPAPPPLAKGGPPLPHAPPPPPPPRRGGPSPPPPPMGGGPPRAPPRAPPPIGSKGPRPLAGGAKAQGNDGAGSEGGSNAPKTKLKPFFWDKVQANSDQTMVWNQLKAGSFQFNEEMMESLFGYNNVEKTKTVPKKDSSSDQSPQFIQIIESKKAQNLSILLRALNVTLEEVCDALLEGNELPPEFLQTLLKMAPTAEEELKLRVFSGDLSQLGPADRFLKSLVDIPFAFKRMETLLYMCSLSEELTSTRQSFSILEVACKELRNSRLFLKLLEAVLKTGNRMNDGTFRGGALAFKLDTLLKLSDVKGIDGKTTLLHFVVQEIIRTEGIRAARMAKESHSFSSIKTDDLLEDITYESEDHYREIGLQVVSRLSGELENVKKAAALDADGLIGTTARLGEGLIKAKEFANKDLKELEGDKGFHEAVKSFLESAEVDVTNLLEEEKKIMALVKSTGDYFHGNAGRDEGLRLFLIVRDFLIMLDKVCKEIKNAPKKPAAAVTAAKNVKPENPSNRGPPASTRPPPPGIRQQHFPPVVDRRMDDFSSDDDSP